MGPVMFHTSGTLGPPACRVILVSAAPTVDSGQTPPSWAWLEHVCVWVMRLWGLGKMMAWEWACSLRCPGYLVPFLWVKALFVPATRWPLDFGQTFSFFSVFSYLEAEFFDSFLFLFCYRGLNSGPCAHRQALCHCAKSPALW